MAPIFCSECGNQVPERAAACPKCAHPAWPRSLPVSQPPWYFSNWIIIPCLLFCFPAGITLMWVGNRWPLWVRIAVSGVTALLVINSGFENYKNVATSSKAQTPKRHVAEREFISETFEELDFIFGYDNNLTNLQKDELWKTYRGKYVRWTGEVTYIDEGFGSISVGIRHKPTTLTYDVLVEFPKSAKDRLLSLSRGQIVTYTGQLSTRGGAILPYSLKGVSVD